jgi:hypothetical protein
MDGGLTVAGHMIEFGQVSAPNTLAVPTQSNREIAVV